MTSALRATNRRLTRTGALAPVLCLVMLAGTACGGSTPDRPTSSSVGLVVANRNLSVSREIAAGFQAGVADVPGMTATVNGPDIVDGPAEIRMFDSLRKSSGGVSVFTLSPDLFAQPLAHAVDTGMPVIAVDNPPPSSSNVSLFIGNDNYELGQLLADGVVKAMPGKPTSGLIVLGTSTPGVPVLEQRARGMRDALARSLPGVHVVGPYDSKQEDGANAAAWALLVKANPHALAFLGTGDADSYHLAAIRKATRGTWIAGGFDLDPRSLQAVKRGDLVLVSPEHYVKGAVAGELQARAAKTGEALPRGWIYTPGLSVNKANIDDIIARQATAASRRAWFAGQVKDIVDDTSAHTRPMSAIR